MTETSGSTAMSPTTAAPPSCSPGEAPAAKTHPVSPGDKAVVATSPRPASRSAPGSG